MIDIINEKFILKDVEGIIFDKDGTITDSSFYWSEIIKRRAKKISKDFNLAKENNYELIREMGLDVVTNKLLPEGPIAIKSRSEVIFKIISYLNNQNIKVKNEDLDNIFKEIHKDFSKEAKKYILPIEPAFRLIKMLKRYKVKLFLITSDTKINAEETIKVLKIPNHFDCVIGGDSGFGDKRFGKGIKHISNKFNLSSEKIISIGDAPVDHEMAVNGNLKASILVESGQIKLKKLYKYSKYCVSDLSEIRIE